MEDKDLTPRPDPTTLTTAQLRREISGLREVIETRLNGMDKAIELLQTTTDKLPERVDEKIQALKGVHDEKFHSIQIQFEERDTRGEQKARDDKVSVDAALAAAKEAVAEQTKSMALSVSKSEASTSRQIEQLQVALNQQSKTQDDKVSDIKERLTRIEGNTEGTTSTKTTHTASSNFVVGILVAIGLGLLGTAVSVITAVTRYKP